VDQVTGLLVPKEDSAALAQAITFLIERPQTAVQMGSAGRLRAQHVFGFQRFVDAYEQLYQRLGNRSAGLPA
jgi:glycosyltransferase involved in cell wall biosynthesis